MTEQNVGGDASYSTTPDAEHGVDALMLEGVPAADISVIPSDAEGGEDLRTRSTRRLRKVPPSAGDRGASAATLDPGRPGPDRHPRCRRAHAGRPHHGGAGGSGAGGTLWRHRRRAGGVGMPELRGTAIRRSLCRPAAFCFRAPWNIDRRADRQGRA